MKLLQQLKIGDLIILIVLVIASFCPFYFLMPSAGKNSSNMVAVIKANNHQIKKLSLDHDRTWTYHSGGKLNVVEVKHHKVRVIDANCKDQVCVKEGWKSKSGDTIVCLPHKFLVEIKK